MKNGILIPLLLLFNGALVGQINQFETGKIPLKLVDSIQNNTWNSNINNYSRNQTEYYTYNAKGELISIKDSYLNRVTNRWINRFKTDYFFKTGTNLVEYSIRTLWDTVGKIYVNDLRTDNTLLNNKVLNSVSSRWNKSTLKWDQSNRSNFTYFSDGLTNVVVFQRFDQATSQWINVSRTTFTYNSDKNITITLFDLWNNSTNTWEKQSIETTTYNGLLRHEVLAQAWSIPSNAFVNVNKKVYTYNTSDLQSEVITHFWNNSNNKFELNSKTEYMYDSDNDLKLTIGYLYNNATSSFITNIQHKYFYSQHEVTNVITSNLDASVLVFPSIAQNMIYVPVQDIRTISIYAIDGQCVFEQSHLSIKSIDVSSLAKGSYFVLILDNVGNIKTSSFIKI